MLSGFSKHERTISTGSNSSTLTEDDESTVDISYLGIDDIPCHYLRHSSTSDPESTKVLIAHHNLLARLSTGVTALASLTTLDLSNNALASLPDELCLLQHLEILLLKNNSLDTIGLPKNFKLLRNLEVLNLSGNCFNDVPERILELPSLRALHLGGNQISSIVCKIGDILSLEILYLGGNVLQDIPATIGKLRNLTSLGLNDNCLETLPSTIAHLHRLRSLSVHNNNLKVLPLELVKLKYLRELSLRGNPLVGQFVRDMAFSPPTMKELAGRALNVSKIKYEPNDIPQTLHDYLNSAHRCVNPKCSGVYFEAKVEHVKFVDFCGKYKVPFLQYLCSPKCGSIGIANNSDYTSSSDGEVEPGDDGVVPVNRLQKVLLG